MIIYSQVSLRCIAVILRSTPRQLSNAMVLVNFYIIFCPISCNLSTFYLINISSTEKWQQQIYRYLQAIRIECIVHGLVGSVGFSFYGKSSRLDTRKKKLTLINTTIERRNDSQSALRISKERTKIEKRDNLIIKYVALQILYIYMRFFLYLVPSTPCTPLGFG